MGVADVLATLVNYAVFLGACVVKMPQVGRIARARSAVGISEASLVIEGCGYSMVCYYSLLMKYQLTAWCENGVITLQALAVLVLYWVFAEGVDIRSRLAALAAWFVGSYLFLTADVPARVLAAVGFGPTLLFAAARVPQVILNAKQGHTGQLAPETFALQLAGNLARLFTTCHLLLGDPIVLSGHLSSAVFNAIILAQIVRYRDATRVVATRASRKVT
mmetsp:Transcript_108956/g.307059  ORF Transcript_108956/g.307059 Transcript_108956/m.307059 type:complete len:219 (-) Transcript_108956:231-887(-)